MGLVQLPNGTMEIVSGMASGSIQGTQGLINYVAAATGLPAIMIGIAILGIVFYLMKDKATTIVLVAIMGALAYYLFLV